ncbi:MAG: putative metal-dependent hydrolase [Ignavibacteria bacterium]|nr:putative metal-dependent hydrolase [Ignavibacteria bacterium]
MLSPEERRRRIQSIKNFPNQLREQLSAISDAQMNTPYRPDGWTVRQVVHHLADAHANTYIRMKLVLTEDNPPLKTYQQEDWATLPDGRAYSIDASVQMLQGLHERLAYLLDHIPDVSWSRTGMHPERGIMTLDDLLVTISNHCATHLQHIEQAPSSGR